MRHIIQSIRYATVIAIGFVIAAGLFANAAWSAQIVIDKPVKAGELTLFPGVKDELAYYYVSDKPRLATNEDGRPQFSFLQYVKNTRSGASDAESREGEGGGIVHAVVELGVTDDQIQEARTELRRLRPGAKIEGPVIYQSGKFALVSSFADEKGDLTEKVVGVGKAPILDGQKAAVSILLTKSGAEILWQSFQTAAPDISFSFEMQLDGYESPKQALIEANFDQIYDHKAFAAGIATPYFQGEIKGAFDDLQQTKAIKLTQVGDDASLQKLIDTAYNKIISMMFDEKGGAAAPSLSTLASVAGSKVSMLDKASALLDKNRKEAKVDNKAIKEENKAARPKLSAAAEAKGKHEELDKQATDAENNAKELKSDLARKENELQQAKDKGLGEAVTKRLQDRISNLKTQITAADAKAKAAREKAAPAKIAADKADAETEGLKVKNEIPPPAIALVASYEMKRIRQRGTITIDLNKYTASSLTMRFDENIGDLREFLDDQAHFRRVNLDDPLYKQRELVAAVDGMNSTDFGEYINFVTVQLRKQHQGGDETFDEVRIDRKNFNSEGNAFKLLYGWKGDEDRGKWFDYDYKTDWSFFGGVSIPGDWQEGSAGAINLAPPYQRRHVTLEADPDLLKDEKVRVVTVSIFYKLGDKEQQKRVTLNPRNEILSEKVNFLLPADSYEYEYEITWRKRGNKVVKSGRQTSEEALLFVDELPEEA